MSEGLFAIKNNFYLGAYQAAINEAHDIETTSSNEVERDVFVNRAYIALGNHKMVISEISDNASMALLAVKLYAQYLSGALSKDDVLAKLQEWLEDAVTSTNSTVRLMAGIIYAHEQNYVEALKACHSGTTLDMHALCVQVYLSMDRPDQAEKVAKAMSAVDDDATLTQLATGWVDLALGGAKVQEAAYIYQELGDKYNWTAQLHNGLAAANMKMGNWDEAERDLQDALQLDPNDAETLSNLVTCAMHLGKPHARYLSQLKLQAPDCKFMTHRQSAEEAFDRAAVAAS